MLCPQKNRGQSLSESEGGIMGLRNRQSEFAKEFAEFVVWLYEQGYEVTFGEAQRTEEMAEIYLKQGKSKAGKDSLHCKKLAFDIFIFKDGKLIEDKNELSGIGIKWESMSELNCGYRDWETDRKSVV